MSSTPHLSSATRSIAHAEREPGHRVGVVADRFEDGGMHHAAAKDLEPTGALAHRAAGALAADALNVDFGAWLRVRERSSAGSERPVPSPNSAAAIDVSVPLRSASVIPLADDQSLHLMKHRRVREIEIVAPIHRPDRDQPHRRIVALHVPNLHRRGVRSQQRERLRRAAAPCRDSHLRGEPNRSAQPGSRAARPRRSSTCWTIGSWLLAPSVDGGSGFGQIERVLHVASRMLGRHVERFEVVVVVLDLGPFENLVAQTREDGADLVANQAERMAKPKRRRETRAA